MKKVFKTTVQGTSLVMDTLTVDLAAADGATCGLSEISLDMPFKNGKPEIVVGQAVTITIEVKE